MVIVFRCEFLSKPSYACLEKCRCNI